MCTILNLSSPDRSSKVQIFSYSRAARFASNAVVKYYLQSVPARSAPRVLQLVLSLQPGGTERLVLDIIRRLDDEIPMAVCCLETEGGWGTQLRDEGIHVTALHRAAGFRPWLGHAVARVARDHDANVIHAHHYSPF